MRMPYKPVEQTAAGRKYCAPAASLMQGKLWVWGKAATFASKCETKPARIQSSGLSKNWVIRIIEDFLRVRNIRVTAANRIVEGFGYTDPSALPGNPVYRGHVENMKHSDRDIYSEHPKISGLSDIPDRTTRMFHIVPIIRITPVVRIVRVIRMSPAIRIFSGAQNISQDPNT
jgi:hypothetical protein